ALLRGDHHGGERRRLLAALRGGLRILLRLHERGMGQRDQAGQDGDGQEIALRLDRKHGRPPTSEIKSTDGRARRPVCVGSVPVGVVTCQAPVVRRAFDKKLAQLRTQAYGNFEGALPGVRGDLAQAPLMQFQHPVQPAGQAAAARWRSPPDRSPGLCRSRCPRPTASSSPRARSVACGTAAPESSTGSITFSSAVNSGSRWWNWYTKPSELLRSRPRAASDSPLILCPAT